MTPKSVDTKATVAFFAGTFNPFTVGHLSIVERCAPLFSKVIVAIGINVNKDDDVQSVNVRMEAIEKATAHLNNVEVARYSGLTVDAARQAGATVLVRGVRDVADFEKERTLADINREIAGIETMLLFTLPQYQAVSSSMVRELKKFGHDVSAFLP